MTEELFQAISDRDIEIINKEIRKGVDLEVRNEFNNTPLLQAAINECPEVVIKLLENGANPHAQTEEGYTALYLLTYKGGCQKWPDAIIKLLEAGGDPNTKIYVGGAQFGITYTLLHMAAENNNSRLVAKLIEADANLDVSDEYGFTALHKAASGGSVDMITQLLESGATLESKSRIGDTPLLQAARKGKLESIVELIKAGADPNIRSQKNLTALHLAAAKGYVEMARHLIDKGANTEIKVEVAKMGREARKLYNFTPLHIAAEVGTLEVVTELLEAGANTEAKDGENETPIEKAIAKGHSEVVTKLRSFQNTNAPDTPPGTSLTTPAIESSNSANNFSPNSAIATNQLKSKQNNQKRSRLAFLTGSIIGILILLGMFLGDSANNSFQQTDAESSNSNSSSSTVDSSSLSEQESKEIIEQWLEAKSRIFAPPYDRELLEELATGERYRNNIGSMDWLQENDAYYEFGVQKVEEIERFATNNDEATVKFRYTEDRTLYMNGEIVPEQSDFKTRTVIYNLQFKQEQWKIESAKIVN